MHETVGLRACCDEEAAIFKGEQAASKRARRRRGEDRLVSTGGCDRRAKEEGLPRCSLCRRTERGVGEGVKVVGSGRPYCLFAFASIVLMFWSVAFSETCKC